MSDYTDSINVLVKTSYLAEQSIEHQQYVFAYTITIENTGDESVQLLSRSWLITDADGGTTNVEGEGVVGQNLILHQQKATHIPVAARSKLPLVLCKVIMFLPPPLEKKLKQTFLYSPSLSQIS